MSELPPSASGNFRFLQQHDPLLVQFCAAAERNFAAQDRNTCLLKLHQFGDALAQHIAAVLGLTPPPESRQAELLVMLQRKRCLGRSVADRLGARLDTARKRAERLTPALLAKAFRGALVPQDPTDEPAAALLERIRSARAAAPSKVNTPAKGRPRKRPA